jgi:WD40 repeat protein
VGQGGVGCDVLATQQARTLPTPAMGMALVSQVVSQEVSQVVSVSSVTTTHTQQCHATLCTQHDSLLLTASGDQHVGVWDAAVGRLRVYCAGHDGSVKAVAPHGSQPDVFASGSRDGGILLWDMRTPSRWSAAKRRMQLAPVLRIDIGALPARLCGGTSAAQGGGAAGAGGAAAPGSAGRRSARRGGSSAGSPWASGGSGAAAGCRRSVTSLLFLHNEHGLISSSDMDGIVKLWDLRNVTSSVRDVTFPSATAAAAADDRARGRSSRGRRSSGAAAGNRIGDKCSSGSSSSSDLCWLGLTCPSRSTRPAGITSMAISPAGAQTCSIWHNTG